MVVLCRGRRPQERHPACACGSGVDGETAALIFSTASSEPRDRSREWSATISNAYYPLDLTFTDEARFSGELQIWSLGPVSLSRLECDGLLYRRHERHLLVDHGND